MDGDDARKKREEVSVQLRKQKRDEQLAKRRAGGAGTVAAQAGSFGSSALPYTGDGTQAAASSANVAQMNIHEQVRRL